MPGSGCYKRKDELGKNRKADWLSGNRAVNSAGVVYVKVLERKSGEKRVK